MDFFQDHWEWTGLDLSLWLDSEQLLWMGAPKHCCELTGLETVSDVKTVQNG